MTTWSRRTAGLTVLALMALICSGCATTERRLTVAAGTTGRIAAGIDLPDLPAECREPMGRVVPKEGEKWRWVQKRWETVADAEDKRVARCAAFYDDVAEGFDVTISAVHEGRP
jgi:hypothetical protein